MRSALQCEVPEGASRATVELVDTGQIPNGGHLRLLRCGADYSIQFGQDELMGSEAAQSEEALAQLAIRRLDTGCGRMLIGGLGMGFTLGAALEALPSNASVVVAELVPKVVEWARGPLAHLFGNMLDDPRVSIVIGDVHDVIITSPGHFDAILLDVDNGPDGFIRAENDRLYCNWGIRAAYAALRPGGVLAIWSAYDDEAFCSRLAEAGFLVDTAKVSDAGGRERAVHNLARLTSQRRFHQRRSCRPVRGYPV
jgi:spermidine synthase